MILWNLQVVVELKPGDLFFFYNSIIYHLNEEVIEGICHSIVAFTQQNMWDYWRREVGKKDKKMETLKTRKKRARKMKVAQLRQFQSVEPFLNLQHLPSRHKTDRDCSACQILYMPARARAISWFYELELELRAGDTHRLKVNRVTTLFVS